MTKNRRRRVNAITDHRVQHQDAGRHDDLKSHEQLVLMPERIIVFSTRPFIIRMMPDGMI